LATVRIKIKALKSEGYNLTGQILDLFFRGHQFESHKPQGYWRLTWSLILELVRLINRGVRKVTRTPTLIKINK
jgi:hypothetical protein